MARGRKAKNTNIEATQAGNTNIEATLAGNTNIEDTLSGNTNMEATLAGNTNIRKGDTNIGAILGPRDNRDDGARALQ